MFERFTRDARAVVAAAEGEARTTGSDTVEAEHLLLALTASETMRSCGVGHADVLSALEAAHERALASVGVHVADFDLPARPSPAKRLRFGASAKRAMHRALTAAVQRGDREILAEHLLLGVLSAPVGTVARALRAGGIDAAALADAAESALATRGARLR